MKHGCLFVILSIMLLSSSAQDTFISIRGDPNVGTEWEVVSIEVNLTPIGNFSDFYLINDTVRVVELLIDGDDVIEGNYGAFDGAYAIFYYTNLQAEMFVDENYVSIDSVVFNWANIYFSNGVINSVSNTTSTYYIQSGFYAIGGHYNINQSENVLLKVGTYLLFISSTIGFVFILVLMRSKNLRNDIKKLFEKVKL